MGTRIPKSGTGLAGALFTSTQQRVLTLLFGQPERSYGLLELIELARAGRGAVQREVERLVESGLVIATINAGRKQLRANADAPIFDELRAIVDKTLGIAELLRDALRPHAERIRFAILYGSVAKRQDTTASDIDVLIVSDDLSLESAFKILQPVESRLGRRISPTIMTRGEFLKRRKSKNPFLTKVLEGKHEVLLGTESAIATR